MGTTGSLRWREIGEKERIWVVQPSHPIAQGLGDYFVTCLRSDIERLKFAAGTHSIVYKDYHHVVSKVFPFGVFYTHDSKDNLAMVWAVIDRSSLARSSRTSPFWHPFSQPSWLLITYTSEAFSR